MKRKILLNEGFTLVEVTLALGVAAFTILTVVGLLSVGVNANWTTSEQTSAINILTSIASDIRSTVNPLPKGTQQTTAVYGIIVPATATGPNSVTASTSFYIGENAEIVPSSSEARYLLTVWTTSANALKPETLVRLLISWPAAASVDNSAGSVESLVIVNRN